MLSIFCFFYWKPLFFCICCLSCLFYERSGWFGPRSLVKKQKIQKQQWFSIENTKHSQNNLGFSMFSAEIIEKPTFFCFFLLFLLKSMIFLVFFVFFRVRVSCILATRLVNPQNKNKKTNSVMQTVTFETTKHKKTMSCAS